MAQDSHDPLRLEDESLAGGDGYWLADDKDSSVSTIPIMINWRKQQYELQFSPQATMSSLFSEIEELFTIPKTNQKYLIPGRQMIKYPPTNSDERVDSLLNKHLTLLGSSAAEVQAVDDMSERIARRNKARQEQSKTASRGPTRQAGVNALDDARYTFLQVKPLEWLPNPSRSQMLLLRLKSDPGIKAVMKKRKLTVALLTEMEPLQHTEASHEGVSRTLGLNRNKGEVIELRLRTDAHDGYRDYKTIRKTLCHELTHNVHSDHDRQFWDLCAQIEKEVTSADWKSGGHTIGETSRHAVAGLDDVDESHSEDYGGWTGGEFVLGGGSSSGADEGGWSRREILARAAAARQRKDEKSEGQADKGWRPCRKPSDETK